MGKGHGIKTGNLWSLTMLRSPLRRYFDSEELRMLLCYTKDEKISVKNRARPTSGSGGEPAYDMTVLNDAKKRFRDNRYDCFRVDYETFRKLFVDLTPWGHCQNVDIAEKLFRVS